MRRGDSGKRNSYLGKPKSSYLHDPSVHAHPATVHITTTPVASENSRGQSINTDAQKIQAELARRRAHGDPMQQPYRWSRGVPVPVDHTKGVGLERVGDVLLGKSLTNLVAHGDTSHLGSAALEAGMLVNPFGKIAGLAKAARAAKVAKAVDEVGTKVRKAAPLRTGKIGPSDVSRSLSEAARIEREQKQLRRLEHGVRASEAARIMDEVPGRAGHAAALKALRGPMPTLRWDRFKNVDEGAVDAMIAHIRAHPSLQGLDKTYTRLNTEGALLSVLSGNLPRPFERKLLRNVFGDQAENDLVKSVSFWKRARAVGVNLIGVPRTLMATADVSAPMRQGLLFGVTHPVLWGKNFPAMVKAFGSQAVYDATMTEIASRPTFDLMQQAKLPFTDLGGNVSHREEQFMSSLAERIPVVGHVVRGSNRAYVTFLNRARADYFDWMVKQLERYRPELDLESLEGQKALQDFARVIGNATGRGTFKNETLARALPLLNQTMFAPRLLKSRLDVIAYPVTALRLDPVARREAFKQLAGLVGFAGGVLSLAAFAGAKVGMDPRNADWAKIKVGNTRFDILAGFQQPLRLIAQLQQGKIVSSTTGKTLTLGEAGGYGHLTRLDITLRFLETKASPPASFVIDWFRGSDFQGNSFSWKAEAYSKLTPLLMQDATDLYRQGDHTAGDVALATALYGIGMWGIGTQTYGPKQVKTRKRSGSAMDSYLGGGTSSSKNSYLGSGSSGGDSSYFGP